ncbi:CRP-like cAMP-binding protein [Flavobacterium tiangeerense]|uniref:CRP-like cAMP-binding protein n=1 Tax=Flavobacterium tiangeerense TaxID=459471 RepID=A0ABY3FL98_9FLAO|nr:Crp/Fnr family transcriptional regulator [Flavobacterium tiangeerense]TWI01232.1 CRP-like cAMP-binding protein [Flavobacterium tiangeerense]
MQEILKNQIDKIVPLTDAEFQVVLSYFSIGKYKKHQYILQQGNSVPYVHFVVKGLLRSFYLDKSGKSHILQFAMEDWWITDNQGFYNEQNATLNIDCLEDAQTYYISLENRTKLCSELLPKIEFFFLQKMTAGSIALQNRVLSLMSKNSEERYTQFIQLYPNLIQRLSKTLVASYLGISRETLSRLSP